MTKGNIKSNQRVIILYQVNYDKLWQYLGLTDSCWVVLTRDGLVLIRVDSCWLALIIVYYHASREVLSSFLYKKKTFIKENVEQSQKERRAV